MILFLLLWPLLFSAASAADAADDLDKSREQLAGIEQRLEKTLADLARNKTVETDVLDELNLVDRQLARLKRKVGTEKKKLKGLNRSIAAETVALRKPKDEVVQLQLQVQQHAPVLLRHSLF